MKRVLLAALLSAGLNVGVEGNLKPCEYEDGSSQKVCVWDAKHMGDGHGKSGVIVFGGTDHAVWIPISHRKAHKLIG